MDPNRHYMRGMVAFINEIRACNGDRELEEARVKKELAKIRKKLYQQKKSLDGYNKRKYIAKALFCYLLGFEVDFINEQAVALLSSQKLAEKLVGYVTLGVIVHNELPISTKLLPSFQTDLRSNNSLFVTFALAGVSNIGGKEISKALYEDVKNIMLAQSATPIMIKKACMCVLQMFRSFPGGEVVRPSDWVDRFDRLLTTTDCGILTSSLSLLLDFAKPKEYRDLFAPLVPKVASIFNRVILAKQYSTDYIYYRVPAPWLQVKILKFLQLYPPPSDATTSGFLADILMRIVKNAVAVKDQGKNQKNAFYCVLFEAIAVAIHYRNDPPLLQAAAKLLGEMLVEKDAATNHVYLILEAMSELARLSTTTANMIKQHMKIVIKALKSQDISIRRRALDLLYGMCDRRNSKDIVAEMISYLNGLVSGDNYDLDLIQELVLKISILAEKYSPHYRWYVDVMLQLIALAGDTMHEAIWFRAIKIITNQIDVQEYATATIFDALKKANATATTVKFGSYILGEYGNFIASKPGMDSNTQFKVIYSKFRTVADNRTKEIMLSTFIKFLNLFPELRNSILSVFEQCKEHVDEEIQQRAIEYLALAKLGDTKMLGSICDVMPPYTNFKISTPDDLPDDITPDSGSTTNTTDNTAVDSSLLATKTGNGPNDFDGDGSEPEDDANAAPVQPPPPTDGDGSSSSSEEEEQESQQPPQKPQKESLSFDATAVAAKLEKKVSKMKDKAADLKDKASSAISNITDSSNNNNISNSSGNSSSHSVAGNSGKSVGKDQDDSDEDAAPTKEFSNLSVAKDTQKDKEKQERREKRRKEKEKEKNLKFQENALKAKEMLVEQAQQLKLQQEEELAKQAYIVKAALEKAHQQKLQEQEEREQKLKDMERALMEKEKQLKLVQDQLRTGAQGFEQKLQERLQEQVQAQEQKLYDELMKGKQILEAKAAEQQQREQQLQLALKQQAAQHAEIMRQQVLQQHVQKEQELRQKEQQLQQEQQKILEAEQLLVRAKQVEQQKLAKEKAELDRLEKARQAAVQQQAEKLTQVAMAQKAEQERLLQIRQQEEQRIQQIAIANQQQKLQQEKLLALHQQQEQAKQILIQQQQAIEERARQNALALAQEQKRLTELAEKEKLRLQAQQQAIIEADRQRQIQLQQAAQQKELLLQQEAERNRQQAALVLQQQQQQALLQQQSLLQQQVMLQQQLQQKAEQERVLKAEQERNRLLEQQRQQQQQQQQQQQLIAEQQRQQQLIIEQQRQQQQQQQQQALLLEQERQRQLIIQQQQQQSQLPPLALPAPQPVYTPPPQAQPLPVAHVHFQAEQATSLTSLTQTAEERATRAVRRLTIGETGVLFEDDMVQLGLKTECATGSVRSELYIWNKTGGMITALRTLIPPVSYVTCQAADPPQQVPPNGQVRMQLIYRCDYPFESYPDMQLSMLVDGRSKIIKIKIPIAITKFCEPLNLDGATWFSRWQQINGKPNEIQEMFKAGITTNAAHISELFLRGFRFAVLKGVDTNPNNMIGCATFCSTKGNVPCFVRIETNPSAHMIRLTVKSASGEVTAALRNIFLLHLGDA